MTDKEYIQAFRDNDQRAIRDLYNRLKQPFKAFILGHFRDNLHFAEVDDVYQDAIIRLQQNILTDKLNEDKLTVPLQSYLNSVGYHVAQEYLRDNREDQLPDNWENSTSDDDDDNTSVNPDDIEDPMEAMMIRERNEMIQQAVNGMGSPCAPLLLGVYWEKNSMEELAAQLGYSNADSAKTQKAKCMKKLKNYISRLLAS